MYEYGESFKYVRHLQEYGRFHFYSRCVRFLTVTRSQVLGAHGISGHLAKHRNPILHAVCESLNQFYIF